MKVDRIYSPFPLLGTKLTDSVNSGKKIDLEGNSLSLKHFPSILPQFQGTEIDERFINSGGYNFMGNKLNYLA